MSCGANGKHKVGTKYAGKRKPKTQIQKKKYSGSRKPKTNIQKKKYAGQRKR